VLLEAPFDPSRRQKNSVLLAIDLTTAVADEAIKRRDSVVVAYRKITLPDSRIDNPGGTIVNPHMSLMKQSNWP